MRKLLVKIACKLGLYQQCVAVDTYFHNRKLGRAFRQYGLETLQKTDEATRSANSRIFLTFGTLLGAYRDHGFIPYDLDLDVGMLAEERPDNIDEIMLSFGFTKLHQDYIKETNRIILDTYQYQGAKIDIFYYYKNGDDLFCYITRRHETKEWRQANQEDGFPTDYSYVPHSDFKRIDFQGIKIYIPTKTHEWLTDIFSSSYMTPIKNWSAKDYKTRIVRSSERAYKKRFD